MDIDVFDMHCDTIGPLGIAECEPYLSADDRFSGSLARTNCELSADRMRAGMRWAQCYAVWVPDECPSVSQHEFYRRGAQWFAGQMERHADALAQVTRFRDIPAILESGRVAAILSVENAAYADVELRIVDEFARDGVKVAGITWNARNALGSGHETGEGLTELGRAYVRALEKRGIVVDVSHLNDAGFRDLERIATRPFIATHSNARAVCAAARNLTDYQFQAIAERGGVVGLNFHEEFVRDGGGTYRFDELVAHVEHWLALGGEDAIALGSDRDGATLPTWLTDCSAQPYLFTRLCERIGVRLARKLFYENAFAFFLRFEG